jgi:hypothetical protein
MKIIATFQHVDFKKHIWYNLQDEINGFLSILMLKD